MRTALILGSGYTGQFLAKELVGTEQAETTRDGRNNTTRFDSRDQSTWEALPSGEVCFWLFPAERSPLSSFIWNRCDKLVVVSSTSYFKTIAEDEEVNELTEIQTIDPRSAAEEELREQGAVIVHSAGIYGPGRNPLEWIRSGRVGRSSKYINFIHVEDLCQFLVAAAERAAPSSRWIACDEGRFRWSELIEQWQSHYQLGEVQTKNSSRPSKLVNARLSRDKLGIKLRYPNVLRGLKDIEG